MEAIPRVNAACLPVSLIGLIVKKYALNQFAVIFLPEVDRLNQYQTIVCNWQTENIIKVDKAGYKILKLIDDNKPIDIGKPAIKSFVDYMLRENIIIERKE